MPFIFLTCLLLCLTLVQAAIVAPLNLLASFHLPFWLSLTLGGIVLSWLLGE